MKKIMLIAGLLGAVAFTQVQAQDRPSRRGDGRNGRMQDRKEMMADLNLSADQKEKMKALREEGRSQMEATRNDKSLTQEQKKTKMEALRQSRQKRMDGILSADQKAKLEKARAERGNNTAMRADKRGGNGMQGKGRDGFRGDGGRFMNELNLTEQQRSKLQTQRQEARSQMEAIRGNTALTAEQKKSRLDALKKEQKAKRDALLTPDQRAKWDEKMAANDGMNHRKGMRNHRGGKGKAGMNRGGRMMDELNLSAVQKDQMKKLNEEGRAKRLAIANDKKLSAEQRRSQMTAFHKEQKAKREAILTPPQLNQWQEQRKATRFKSEGK